MEVDAVSKAGNTENALPAPAYQQLDITFVREPSQLASVKTVDSDRPGNFWRQAQWCPDGSCILTQEEDRLAKIFALPPDLINVTTTQLLKPYIALQQSPSAMLGLRWYPFAAVMRPETFCFLRSCRDVPVHLIDGLTGKIRASYSIIDHQERFIGPHSMTFSPDAQKLYGGFDSAIEAFDVANPGNNGARLLTSATKRSRAGQKGIISALSASRDSSMLAAGSFARNIWLYDTLGGEPRAMRSLKAKSKTIFGSGITQVSFHPADQHLLYAASRGSDCVPVWDIRQPNEPLLVHLRPGKTSQRLHFNIDARGKWLTMGGTDGKVHFFDTEDPHSEAATFCAQLSKDAISTAELHPYLQLLLTTSGSRRLVPQHFDRPTIADSNFEDSASDTDCRSGTGTHAPPEAELAVWRVH